MLIPFLIGKLFSLSWASYVSLFPVIALCSLVGLLCLVVALLITRNVHVASSSSLVLSGSEGEIARESDFERKLDAFGGLEDGLSDFEL